MGPDGGYIIDQLQSGYYTVEYDSNQSDATRGLALTFDDKRSAIHIAPKQLAELAPGNYEGATRYPFNSSVLPGLDADIDGEGCNQLHGRFVVYDLELSSTQNVTSAAFDFSLTCDDGSATIVGGVRINSDIAFPYDLPHAAPGKDQVVSPGDTVTLDGGKSTSDGATTYHWVQKAGPTVKVDDPTAQAIHFVAPDVSGDSTELTFALTVTDPEGRSNTAQVHVTDSRLRSRIYWNPKVYDWVSQGTELNADENSGAFIVASNTNANTVNVTFDGVPGTTYQFSAPFDEPLKPGLYPDAKRLSVVQGSGTPGMDVESGGHGCNTVDGYFVVHEYNLAADGSLDSLAIDFVQACLDGGGDPVYLHGFVRYRSAVPITVDGPIAYAGANHIANVGDTYTLNGQRSLPEGSPISSYHWQQISGTPVALQSADQPDAVFVAPDVPPGGDDLVFKLTTTDDAGLTSSATVTIHVRNPDDAQTAILLESQPGDWLGQGKSWYQDTSEVALTSVILNDGSGTVLLLTNGPTPITVMLSPVSNHPLEPGNYADIGLARQQLSFQAGLDVSIGTSDCVPQNGWITIYEAEVTDAQLVKLAADFEATCLGSTAPIDGFIRVNSSVPLIRSQPTAFPAAVRLATEQFAVSLDGSRSRSLDATLESYHWEQISGPAVTIVNADSVDATFTAPNVDPGGADLGFRLTVTDSDGRQDSNDVVIHVRDTNDPQDLLDASAGSQEPLTHGFYEHYNANNADFYAHLNAAPSNVVSISVNSKVPFSVTFAPPQGQTLSKGIYNVSARPGDPSGYMEVTAGDAVCTDGSAIFQIEQIVLSNNTVTAFAADFTLHCQNAASSLTGSVRFNSAVPLTSLSL